MTNLPPVIKIVPMPGIAGIQGTQGLQGPAGTGGGVDSTVPFELNDTNDDLLLSITKTGTGTTRIDAPQDDLSLRSARDITLYPGTDGAGNVYIGWGDASMTPNSTNRVATIADIEQGTTGDITFDGVQIIGAGTASGDGSNNGTIELVPDADLDTDQYLIIDPTAPDHIHIRAGGTQDESTADLIVGGERNNVFISDSQRQVTINTRPATITNTYENINEVSTSYFITTMPADIDAGYTVNVGGTDYTVTSVTPNSPSEGQLTAIVTGATFNTDSSYTFTYDQTWNNGWIFDTNGTFSGPAMGSVIVNGLTAVSGQDLTFYSGDQDIKLYTESVSDMPVGYRYPAIKNVTNDDSPPFSVNDILPASLLDMGRTLWNDYPETVVYYEIPLDSTLNFPLGAEIKFACGGVSAFFIISEDNDVVTVIGEGDNYSYTLSGTNYFILPPDRIATLTKLASNRWIFSGFGVTD